MTIRSPLQQSLTMAIYVAGCTVGQRQDSRAEAAISSCDRMLLEFRQVAHDSGFCTTDADCIGVSLNPIPNGCCIVTSRRWWASDFRNRLGSAAVSACGRGTYRCYERCQPKCLNGYCSKSAEAEYCGRPDALAAIDPQFSDCCRPSGCVDSARAEQLKRAICHFLHPSPQSPSDWQLLVGDQCVREFGGSP